MTPTRTLEVTTPSGPARLHTDGDDADTLLVLGHGAGGGVEAPDLLAARDAALALGLGVVRVEQPYRVAGRRAPERAPRLDAAWEAVCAALDARLVTGGRSSGARVACRTATATGALGVVALAFPLQPPRGRPDRSAELAQVDVPLLVVNGSRDVFGVPTGAVVVEGADHALRSRAALDQVRAAVTAFLQTVT